MPFQCEGVLVVVLVLFVGVAGLGACTGYDDGSSGAGEPVFRDLPIIQLSYICNESIEICFFQGDDFNDDFEFTRAPATQFSAEFPAVPQVEYDTECKHRDANDDWELSILGNTVRECHFLLTLAAYPLDIDQAREAEGQIGPTPLPPPSPPLGVFPPRPGYQLTPLPTPQYRYEEYCTVRPPVTEYEGFSESRVVRHCRTIPSMFVPTPVP